MQEANKPDVASESIPQAAEPMSAEPAPEQPKPQAAEPQSSRFVDFFYRLETYLKIYFMVTSLFGWKDATIVGFVASLLGLLRMTKRPQFNQEYLKYQYLELRKFLTNQFGLNIVYFIMLAAQHGPRTYLFYAPIVLHYFLGIVEFLNIRHKQSMIKAGMVPWVEAVRASRKAIIIYKGKLQFMYEMMLLFTLPFDLGLILSVVMLGQCLLLKHKITEEFKYTMYDINGLLQSTIGRIPVVSFIYDKICLALSKM